MNVTTDDGFIDGERKGPIGIAVISDDNEEDSTGGIEELDDKICRAWSPQRIQAVANRWKLSATERCQLQEMRSRLADIHHEKNDPEEVVRFLREAHSLKATERMFRKFIEFRIQHADTIVQDYQPHPVLQSHYPITLLNGFDKDGDGIWLERTGATDMLGLYHRFGRAEMIKYQLWAREKAMHTPWRVTYEAEKKRSPRVICIMDMQGLSSRHMSPFLLPILAEVVALIQDFYCGFIKKIIVIREPAIFGVIWSLVKHFFNDTMKQMMVFAGSDYRHVLKEYIDDLEETLPPSLLEGGRGTIAEGMPQRMDGGPLPPKTTLTRNPFSRKLHMRDPNDKAAIQRRSDATTVTAESDLSQSSSASKLYMLPRSQETHQLGRHSSTESAPCSKTTTNVEFRPVRCRPLIKGFF